MATSVWSAAIAACVVFLIMTLCAKSVQNTNTEQNYNDIERVLKSIEKLLDYYRLNVMSLNLDGFFGVRVLEGHMLVMLQEHRSGKHQNLPPPVWQNISRMAKMASKIGVKGMSFVRKDNPNYFDDFSSIVKHPWAFFKTPRRLDPDLRWEIPQYKAKTKTQLSEKLSDKCMREIMNSSLSSSSSSGCHVSELCLRTMTHRGLTGYGITHQLLWSMIVELSTCKQSVEAAFKSHSMDSLESMQLEMCTNNFYEMIAVVHVLMKGTIHESHQDLFLEQQFVCPSLGFYEFIKRDYLDQILSWQYPSGCFGDREEEEEQLDDDSRVDVESLLETYHKKHEDDIQPMGNNAFVQTMQPQRDSNSKPLPVAEPGTNDHILDQHQKSNKSQQLSLSPYRRNRKQGVGALYTKKTNQEIIRRRQDSIWNSATNPGRKLLVEKRLTGDCLSHKTGVAAGALMIYLRFLIQPGNIAWDGPHELFEMDRRKMVQSNGMPGADYLDGVQLNNDDNDEDEDLGVVQLNNDDNDEDGGDDNDEDEDLGVMQLNNNDEDDDGGDDNDDDGGDDNDEEEDGDDENVYYEESTERGKMDGDRDNIQTGDLGEEESVLGESEEMRVNKNNFIQTTRLSLIPNQKLNNNNGAVKERLMNKGDNSFANVFYNNVEGVSAKTNHPSASLIFLVSLSPMIIVMFLLFKIFRRYRVLSLCFWL